MTRGRRWRSGLLLAVFVLGTAKAHAAEPLPLDGPWRFQLDRRDAGVQERWFARSLPAVATLPGSLPAQGIGDDVTVDTPWIGGIVDRSWFTAPQYAAYRKPGNIKVPFWLQPQKVYAGAAWYQRDLEIPAAWKEQRTVLWLERPHWETRAWLDDKLLGSHNALATPHEYDLGQVPPGRHTLTLRVDNRMIVDIGENSHSVSDHTQGNWNGIVGRIELRPRPLVWIDRQRVFATNDGTVRVEVDVRNTLLTPAAGSLRAIVREKGGAVVGQASAKFDYPRDMMSDGQHAWTTHAGETLVLKLTQPPKLWDEGSPALYELQTRLETTDGRHSDEATQTFGFRQLTAQGTQLALNGRKIFVRGTLECCIFPKTGHPPTDVAEWKRILGVARAHGLNLLRFHSWCPPEAAFVAADEMGFLFHVECSSWANQSTTLGDGKPVDKWIYDEADRILASYGNHPSFVLMLYGNEPGGGKHAAYLSQWVAHYKAKDPRRLYSGGAGWPELPQNQFHNLPGPRIQGWGEELRSRINARPPETRTDYREFIGKRSVPVISHEIGQWCVYPNFDEMAKYTGYLKPRNFEIFRERLAAHHMLDQARAFLLASGKLQTLCYKEEIESALRTPGMGGFELLDLHDFPGQGTALVGVLDPFWESKGYVTAEEFRRFCNTTVPLARLAKRAFTSNETLEAEIEVAHFGLAPLPEATTAWKLVGDDGKIAARGVLPAKTIPVGNGIALGQIRADLKTVPAPARYKLVVGLEQTPFENDWDLWVYPPAVATQAPPEVLVAEDLDPKTLAALQAGGKVLLLIPARRVANPSPDKVALGFSSIFWNTAWTRRQAPTTLGILCDPRHPALATFPTDSHSNWQWWYLVTRSGAMILDDLPAGLRPIVQVVDDWVTARKLGLVFEAKLGPGKLLVCSVDLARGLEQSPVARQMLSSLLRYAASPQFQPQTEVSKEMIAGLFRSGGASALVRLGAKVHSVDSEDQAHGNAAACAIDGDPETIWHTRWEPHDPMPHQLVVDLGRAQALRGVTYLPRQEMTNGRIAQAEIYVSRDGKQWGTPVAQAKWPDAKDLQTVRWAQPVEARYVKLLVRSEVRGQPFAAVAELDVIVDAK